MTFHPKDLPLPSALKSAELEAAEAKYCLTAFDLVAAPLGSRDWALYWRGWHDRSRASLGEATEANLNDAQRKDLLMAALYLSADESDACVLKSTDAIRIVQTLFDIGELDALVTSTVAKDAAS